MQQMEQLKAVYQGQLRMSHPEIPEKRQSCLTIRYIVLPGLAAATASSTTTLAEAVHDTTPFSTEGQFDINFSTADTVPRQIMWWTLSA